MGGLVHCDRVGFYPLVRRSFDRLDLVLDKDDLMGVEAVLGVQLLINLRL